MSEKIEKAIDPDNADKELDKELMLAMESQRARTAKLLAILREDAPLEEETELSARGIKKTPQEEKSEGWNLPPFLPFLISNGIVAVALVAAGLWIYHHNFAPKAPVAIDIRGYVEEQKQFFAEGKINSEQLRRNMDHLEEVVARISSRQAVFMADAVIKNVEIIKP